MNTGKKHITRILVVDDNEAVLDLITDMLEQEDYLLKTTINGNEALNQVKSFAPDLILLDINLKGDLSGFEVCNKLKLFEETKHIPILFVTGDSSRVAECFKVGGVDLIAKPFSKAELLARIENHLNISRQNQALRIINDHLETTLETSVKEKSFGEF